MRMLIHFTHFPLQPTVKQTLKFLRGRVNLRLAPPSFRGRKPGLAVIAAASTHVFPCESHERRGLIDIMGWFPWDDTPPDAGAPVDEDTYVVTYCRN